jgi:hypothetical protein
MGNLPKRSSTDSHAFEGVKASVSYYKSLLLCKTYMAPRKIRQVLTILNEGGQSLISTAVNQN